ncbi:MAG: NAD(P)-binding protein [Halanaerobiales bacterium]
MEIAIIGAGLSGLACALRLEKDGIIPVIFEKRNEVGDRFINGEILLAPLSFPIDDTMQYLSRKYNIHLNPLSPINKLIIYSKNKQAEITGHLGFTNIRGRHYQAWEKQLARSLKSNIIFNSNYSYQDIYPSFDRIMIATGDAAYAEKINNFYTELSVCLKGAIIKGKFELDTVRAWINRDISPGGYGYLIPIASDKANIVIGLPQRKNKADPDPRPYWENFLPAVYKAIDQDFEITSHFHIKDYMIGHCYRPQLANTYFIGNNFGAIMPFLGFGQFPSLLTGIYAAIDITGKGNYQKLSAPLRKSYHHSVILRKSMEKLTDSHFDKLVSFLNTGIGQRVFTGKINYLKAASHLLRPLLQLNRE